MSAAGLQSRIQQLAQILHHDYADTRILLVCTLKGAHPFFCHLGEALQSLRHGYDVEFVRASSYEGTSTTGQVKISGLDEATLADRHVVIVEDILDTGTTLAHLVPQLQKAGQPASIQVVTLLDKRINEEKLYQAKYVGFSIPNHFIIGYGLDYNELYRDVADIFIISPAGIAFDASQLYKGNDKQ